MQFYLALGRIVFLYHKMIILFFFNRTIKSEELLVPEGPPPGTLPPSWVDTARPAWLPRPHLSQSSKTAFNTHDYPYFPGRAPASSVTPGRQTLSTAVHRGTPWPAGHHTSGRGQGHAKQPEPQLERAGLHLQFPSDCASCLHPGALLPLAVAKGFQGAQSQG